MAGAPFVAPGAFWGLQLLKRRALDDIQKEITSGAPVIRIFVVSKIIIIERT